METNLLPHKCSLVSLKALCSTPIFYINLSNPLSASSHLVVYADDILLYKTIKSQENYSNLQSYISILAEHIHICHLNFSPSKCKVLIA